MNNINDYISIYINIFFPSLPKLSFTIGDVTKPTSNRGRFLFFNVGDVDHVHNNLTQSVKRHLVQLVLHVIYFYDFLF